MQLQEVIEQIEDFSGFGENYIEICKLSGRYMEQSSTNIARGIFSALFDIELFYTNLPIEIKENTMDTELFDPLRINETLFRSFKGSILDILKEDPRGNIQRLNGFIDLMDMNERIYLSNMHMQRAYKGAH